ncbi:ribosome biogenesis regulatory protein homolog [Lineus longissimus]|uniref:ribosome biogenesis regulatory protein homolog n=1 Tax=Lineus longissimus TaxID=88925 RepID=UPI002B4DDFC1
MADLVESVLQSIAEKEAKYKTVEVPKDIELEIDEGNLLAIDPNPLELKLLRLNRETFLKDLARDNTQLLINKLWKLPVERKEDVIVAKLPAPKTIIPREKPVPKEKKTTRWEQYAALKGIQNKKKGRMVYDEVHKEYRPRWGYKRANDETKEWVIEVPQNADPYEDQFAKKKKEKTERSAKNELQRLRNIARSHKMKVPGVGLTPTDTPSKDHVQNALRAAKRSTASVGKFTKKLPAEKPGKDNRGKKRKFEPNISDFKKEKKNSLEILNRLSGKNPKLDVNKAVNQHLREEDEKRRERRENGEDTRKKTGRRSKAGQSSGKGKGRKVKMGKPGGKKGGKGKKR